MCSGLAVPTHTHAFLVCLQVQSFRPSEPVYSTPASHAALLALATSTGTGAGTHVALSPHRVATGPTALEVRTSLPCRYCVWLPRSLSSLFFFFLIMIILPQLLLFLLRMMMMTMTG